MSLEWYRLHIWGCYFSWQSLFQLVIHPAWHSAWCTLHISWILYKLNKGCISRTPLPQFLPPSVLILTLYLLPSYQCSSVHDSAEILLLTLSLKKKKKRFWPCHSACGISVPILEIEPRPTAVVAWSPNHWTTRESPCLLSLVLSTLFKPSHQVLNCLVSLLHLSFFLLFPTSCCLLSLLNISQVSPHDVTKIQGTATKTWCSQINKKM